MEMKRSYILMAALAAMVLNSCQSVIEPAESSEQKPVEKPATSVFTAVTESTGTKTALAANGENYDVVWCDGDEITIVDGAATPNVGVYSTTSTTTKGDFTFVSGSDATTSPYTAYYPASLYNDGTPALPAVQTYSADNITGAPMYAESSSKSLKFKNLTGIIRLNITTTAANRKVRKIVLTANDALSGPFSVSGNAAVVSSGSAGVTLDCGTEGVAIGSAPTSFCFAVPEGSHTGLQITVFTTDGGTQTRTSNKGILAERSSITDINLAFNNLAVNATDLSEKATANTYIVSSGATTYKFKATVKGNGGLDPVTGNTATPISESDIDGVAVLWELNSAGNAIKFADGKYEVYYSDGYVFFRTPDTFAPGNAYVAVYKDGTGGTPGVFDKDTDEILWSWLIWSVSGLSSVEYNQNTFLDRNLGALVGTGYEGGFAYQWGRPAPFSAAYSKQYTPYTYYPSRTSIFNFENIGSGTTVAYATAHPTTFFQPPRGNWMSAAAFRPTLWSDIEKTIYDPSPIGWKVPSKAQLEGITSAISFYGSGFIGTCGSDFGYGNPGSVLLWSSSCDNYSTVWANAYGSITSTQVDVYFMSGMNIRPVEDLGALDLSDYTDLGATATANSYIIPEVGDYKFPATVKGNGAADLAGISKDTDPGTIASASLVWASYGTAYAPASSEMIRRIGYKDGYLYFSTGDAFKEGNAVVAIKDASGTILWSWHLWFTDDDIEAQKKTYPGGAVFMDRNLGALKGAFDPNDTGEFGLLYQWGRKDPFNNVARRGSGYVSSSNYTTAYQPAVLGQAETGMGVVAGAAYTLALMVSRPYEAHYEYYDGSSFLNNSWASGMTDNLWAPAKTIFDPCPPGWKVPSKSAWDNTFLSEFTGNQIRIESITQYNYTSSYQVGVATTYGWFPSTGYHLSQAYYTTHGNQSYKEANGNGVLEQNSGYHIRIWASDGILLRDSFATSVNGTLDYSNFGRYTVFRTNANSVRCVKE